MKEAGGTPSGEAQTFQWGWLFGLTAFVSAFLLFQVQPLIARAILPWFGGGPSIWTVSMLFFQAFLFLGYAYAHVLARWLPRNAWLITHFTLLAVAIFTLPVNPHESWKPADASMPELRLLLLLTATVGLPYFLLSSTAPLIQHWYSKSYPTSSPYRLYALSNFGSLLALVSYPFAIEPVLGLWAQGMSWSALFVVFAVSIAGSAAVTLKSVRSGNNQVQPGPTSRPVKAPPAQDRRVGEYPPTWPQYALWLLLPMCASVMLLAATNFICQDIAPVPLLWIAPLALYLLSFVFTFESDWWYRRWIFIPLFAAVTWVCFFVWAGGVQLYIVTQVITHLLLVFNVAMICHGELARRRPPATHLTKFYLMISAGGALGGIFVALIAPQIFTDFYELQLGVLACWGLILGMFVFSRIFQELALVRLLTGVVCLVALVFLGGILLGYAEGKSQGAVEVTRNFYGVLKVLQRPSPAGGQPELVLRHGRIVHGVQFVHPDNRLIPISYYDVLSGVGQVLRAKELSGSKNVGLVGLGVGTLTAYGKPGDTFRIYEINAEVVRLARTHFTYLENCQADLEVVLGDARLMLEREAPQGFDVLVLDAFSGDSIPVHLLTKEACQTYLRHLAPNGILAFHISNQYVDLVPVLKGLASHFQLAAHIVATLSDDARGSDSSNWVLLAHDADYLTLHDFGVPLDEWSGSDRPPILWTDDHSPILRLLRQE